MPASRGWSALKALAPITVKEASPCNVETRALTLARTRDFAEAATMRAPQGNYAMTEYVRSGALMVSRLGVTDCV